MSEIALTVSVLALVAVVGLWIGNVKIRGVGFGIGGVLFGGIIVGHFVDQAGHRHQHFHLTNQSGGRQRGFGTVLQHGDRFEFSQPFGSW